MNERISPFHCPYCGDEDLRPHVPDEGPGHGTWECRSCMRAFRVKFLGLLRPEPTGSTDRSAS
jgi:transposase-like protein